MIRIGFQRFHAFQLAALLSWLGLVLPPCAHGSALKAGASVIQITPTVGTAMNGSTVPIISKRIHDELHSRALVVDDGNLRIAWVVVDNCLIDREFFDYTKELIAKRSGIHPTNVMISTTHTHSAGSVTGVHLAEPDARYREWLPDRIAAGVQSAVDRLVPARFGWARGSVPQHVFCRRIRMRPGLVVTNQLGAVNDRIKMNWSSPHPADLEFSGPTDPEVTVLSFRHTDDRPLAVLANYSLHYVGGTADGDLSSDYYGEFCNRLGAKLGASMPNSPFVAIMSNGTSGDINNVDFRVQAPPRKPYEQIQRVAEDVASEVQRVLSGIEHRSEVSLSSSFTELILGTRKPTRREMEKARDIVRSRPASELKPWVEMYAREQLILAAKPAEVSVPMQVFRIGPVAVAAWPGEIFAISGLELKRRSPIQPLFNVSLANGWFGYIAPPEQHAEGAYETFRGRTAWMETNATVRMLDRFVTQLEQLK